ncbi:MAG: 50S ribosomal protein L11 methyltransferase [Clostridia bacterium]|nr:50S ribosomal protein L11 methyltransferase [Clostridia bacterium]
MEWIQVSITTTPDGIDALCGILMELGINGFEIEDEGDFHRFLEENKKYWDYVDEELLEQKKGDTKVKIYVSNNESGAKQLNEVREKLQEIKSPEFGSLEIELVNMNEEDWAENWKQFFHPLKIGERVLIQPEWEPADDTEGRVVFTVNPGMIFGTGSHHTTQLCIEQLEARVKEGMRVLDLGCGSGILSIIALLLGAGYAEAIDIDPNAEKIAYDNAERNGVSRENYVVHAGNILTDEAICRRFESEKYDMVLANIVADVIIPLADIAPRFMKPDSIFVTSGIIMSRIDEVLAALSKNFEIISVHEKKDWAAIVCKPKA